MNPPPASTQIVLTAQAPGEVDKRLRGRRLLLARVAWAIIAVPALGLYTASVPTFLAFLHILCTSTPTTCTYYGQLTPNDVLALQAMGLSPDFFATYEAIVYIVFVVVYVAIGGVIFWRRSDDPMALFASLTLVTFPGGFNSTLLLILPSALLLPDRFVAFLGSTSLFLFFYLFPTGRFVPRWTRWLSIGVIAFWAVYAFLPFLHFNSTTPFTVLLLGFVCSALVAQIYRYQRVSSTLQRQQTKWVVFGISISFGGFLILGIFSTFFPSLVPQGPLTSLITDTAYYLVLLIIPLSVGIAILRSRLFDIDLLINRTLVYGTLSISVVGLHALVVVGLGALFQARGNLLISLVATGLIALLFQPLRTRLQRAVNRLMYGDRDDPYRSISRLGKRLEATLIPDAILPTIVETVAQALKLSYVAIELQEEEQLRLVAAYGTPVDPSLRLPLRYQQETIGQLLLASRSPGESFTSADRLARELHDSVSQALYGISLGAHAARTALSRDPAHVAEPLDYILTLAEAALAEMRALIFELRPESLETEGLVSALTRQVAALQARHQLVVSTDLCEEPDLSLRAKQELNRIAQEAMHNTVKHAHASRVDLRLEQTPTGVMLEVYDDGGGFDTTASFPGHLGLHSMRERVTNLGGTFRIESTPGVGTRMCVRIPGRV